ncbi:2-keto-4-pentenoate hydratase [Sinisalibacter aestuarii]|uniref:4-oxalocrotonate decarboxylase n=1 Tax=Sinisalibacter aestuarii TaxID=2949426 RepID=A0ABQ5LYV8_9RHOB|nr:fumarylacetoacetate hydrolase family protein [Sinisalibacter aestuarii]GKY90154.1 4-oxalocrotonate decarboxylase [Sinisalibacter aestuarii]
MADLPAIAEILDEAARTANAVAQISETTPLTSDDAYRVQALSLERRYARGERRVGVKMGLTSRAKMAQVGVDDVVWGRLTSAMRIEEGGHLSRAAFVHPRIEPEIAFLMKAPLSGEVSAMEALAAVEAVAPALEVIDSRYHDFRFDLGDVIADNASSAGFVIGPPAPVSHDIANLGMVLTVNGHVAETGSSAAIMGHPLRALVAAARMVATAGEELRPGDIVLAGAATAAVPLMPGQAIALQVEGLGAVAVNIGD